MAKHLLYGDDMRKFKLNKLLRDKLLDSIKQREGGMIDYEVLDDQSFIKALQAKLQEEVAELTDVTSPDELLGELADLQEIIDTLLSATGASKKDLQQKQKAKNDKVGSFKGRYFVHTIELQDDSDWIKYYQDKGFKEVD